MRWPLLYGYLFSRTNAVRPACTTSGSVSRCASASQKMQSGVTWLASVTYVRRQGVHSRSMRRATLRPGALVDEVFQFLARLEVRHFLRRHVHLVARLRIPSLARLAPAETKTA